MVCNLEGAAVAPRQDAAVDVAEAVAAEAAAAAVAGGGCDVAVVLFAEGGNDEEIVPAQERHDDPVVGGCNSVDCSHHIDYFGMANAVGTGSSPETDVERGAE